MEEIVKVALLKAAIKVLNGDIPEPKYSFEKYEMQNTPVSYYKCILYNIIINMPDESSERRRCCSSSDCSNWKTGSAPESCKQCTNYHNPGDNR